MPELWHIIAAIAIDLILGDPQRMPHLTRAIGWITRFWETRFLSKNRIGIAWGMLFFLLVAACVIAPLACLLAGAYSAHPYLGHALSIFIIYQSIAFKDLIVHVKAILEPLRQNHLKHARERLSWIVGRDTQHLSPNEIARAAIESLAESFNDGVIAPLFWAILLGPLGAGFFRVVNTLDSLVGHREHPYETFGKISARMDDFMGYVPARISALLLWLARPSKNIKAIFTDSRQHPSINAGYPEATVAYTQNICLGGENTYEGVIHERTKLHACGHAPNSQSLQATLRQTHRAYTLAILAMVVCCFYVK